jgi:subtilisin family serine protease
LAAASAGVGGAAGSAPNDPLFAQQWGMQIVGAPAGWARSTGQGVLIGVVDTGVDLQHQDLAGKVAASTACVGTGGDTAKCSGNGQDIDGHGTHVSGIAAALTNNGKGVAGMAPGAGLVVARVFQNGNNGPTADTNDVNAGIAWVVDHGAQVVNLSLGGNALTTSLFGSGLNIGIDYAWSKGAIPVLASGNTNLLGLGSSEYGNINAVVVGATDRTDRVASYSSPTGNAKWAIVAPGGADPNVDPKPEDGIISTYYDPAKPSNGLYASLAGTSMAAPHVTGALALLLAQGYNQTGAVDRLLATANRSVSCGCSGRLDVSAAVGSGPAASVGTTTAVPPTTRVARPARSGNAATPGTGVRGPIGTQPVPSSSLPSAQDTGGPGAQAATLVPAGGAGGVSTVHQAGPARGAAVWVLAGLALAAGAGTVGATVGVVRHWPRLG